MILQKYLIKNLVLYLFSILFILIVIFLFIAYLHFIGEAAAAKLNSNDIFKMLITEIPVLLQPILPLSLYLAIIIVFRKLYSTNEIMSMHSLGVSELKLFLPVIILSAMLCLFACYMQLSIFPLANTKRIHLFEDSIHKLSFDKVFPKQFNQLPSDKVIYIDKKIDNEKKLEGIFFSFINPDKKNQLSYDVIVAKSIEEQILPDKSKFLLFLQGTRYVAKLNNLEALIIKFDKFGIRLTKPDYRLEDWPGCMQTKALYLMSKVDRYAAAEFHWRISIPISIINLTFFAIAFNKGRIKGYARPLTSIYPILVYLLYVNLLLAGVGLIKNGFLSNAIGLWGIHFAMIIYCIFTIHYKPN